MASELGQRLPDLCTAIPGAVSLSWIERLADSESPAFTTRRARRAERSGSRWDPIVWREARGANVVDVDGNVFVDLAGGFGVALLGHGHPVIRRAIAEQSETLIHAFGDVHPSEAKIALLDRLAGLAPWPESRVILGLHGGDAVEVALKTALLRTGRPGVLAFEGAYHGLSHGPLALCGYSEAFRAPFEPQLNPHVVFTEWPRVEDAGSALRRIDEEWERWRIPIGAVVVEPIQGRGGVRLPPAGFLQGLGELARHRGALVVADEIFVGLGRCGSTFVSLEEGLDPDLIAIGKALGGGMPISACLGRAEVMAAWGDPRGEALHTATFLGNPLACTAALAALGELERARVPERAREIGEVWRGELEPLREHATVRDVRGRGLFWGIELADGALTLRLVSELLQEGWITLPAGADASVLQLVPPLDFDFRLRKAFIETTDRLLRRLGA